MPPSSLPFSLALALSIAPILPLLLLARPTHACTSLAAGRLATADGATYVASSTDCDDCDFRLAKVASAVHAPGATRPLRVFRETYPHLVGDRAATWHPRNLEASPPQRRVWLRPARPLAALAQPPRTRALLEAGAGYAIVNDRGVSVAESSCPARFLAKPAAHGGRALLDVSELSRLALERADTARDAVLLMGRLAVQHGFYGADWDEDDAFMVAGESLLVADGQEVWMFHVLPDDTAASAVWAAQRVPDADVVVVANIFMIRAVEEGNPARFLYSSNMHEVARRNGLWDPVKDGHTLDFTKTFTAERVPSQSTYVTLRTWRVYTMVNPDLMGTLDPNAEERMEDYPFSVTPKRKLTRDDLFRIYRDHFEGTRFDLTKGEAGGPFGDPNRYDPAPVRNMTAERIMDGEFGRAVSITRTSYTAIVRSTRKLPREVGSLVYFAQHSPATSVFVPIYLAVREVPRPLMRGSLFRYSNESLYWAMSIVSNWVHRYYNHAFPYLQQTQKELESYDVAAMDEFLAALVTNGQFHAAQVAMEKFSGDIVDKVHREYGALFWRLVTRFHDGFVMDDADAPSVEMKSMFYPEWWLRQVGYFSARETGGSYGRVYAKDMQKTRMEHEAVAPVIGIRPNWSKAAFFSGVVIGALSCMAVLHVSSRWMRQPDIAGYKPIR